MLAYAPRPTGRAGSPRTLLLVAAGHVVALALVLTARSEFAGKTQLRSRPTSSSSPTKPPPPPPPPDPDPAAPTPSQSAIDTPPVIIPTPAPPSDPIAAGPPVTSFDPVIGNAVEPRPTVLPDPPKPVARPPRRALHHPRRRRPPALPGGQAAARGGSQPAPVARHRRARPGDVGVAGRRRRPGLPRRRAAPHPAPLALPAGERGRRGDRLDASSITLSFKLEE